MSRRFGGRLETGVGKWLAGFRFLFTTTAAGSADTSSSTYAHGRNTVRGRRRRCIRGEDRESGRGDDDGSVDALFPLRESVSKRNGNGRSVGDREWRKKDEDGWGIVCVRWCVQAQCEFCSLRLLRLALSLSLAGGTVP